MLRIALLFFLASVFVPHTAFAGTLSFVSDRISVASPGTTTATHEIQFTVPSLLPLGSAIVVRFEQNGASFMFPSGLDFADVDLSIASTSGPINRSLAAVASPVADGVAMASGTSPSVRITLGDAPSGAIPATATATIRIGTNATFGTTGDTNITNPTATTSYRIRIETRDSSDALIDSGTAMIAIVDEVGMGPLDTRDLTEAVISNGLPNGLLAPNISALQMSFQTDKLAVCRYSTVAGTAYAAMTGTTTSSNFGQLHHTIVTGLTNGAQRTYYIRCLNNSGIENTADYVISFEIGIVPQPGVQATPPAPSGVSGGGGGGGGLYLTSGDVTLDGFGPPGAKLVVLKDGLHEKDSTVATNGGINEQFLGLQRGTYTWGVYAVDPKGRRTSTFNSVIYLIAGSNNIIAPIHLSPTIGAPTEALDVGASFDVEGYAIPNTPIQVIMNRYNEALSSAIVYASTSANGAGYWKARISGTGLTRGTYEVKAKSLLSTKEESLLSPTAYVGIGEDAAPNFCVRSDFNGDGKVNLIDFSILLFNWRTTDSTTDVNQDGTVNLTDFSIMLSCWGG
ncbi:MAG TPA: dockerin type I domain-containing protein [Candidatus Paceibacterota bacterium]|nr:dockerin type I domain-containing protein [Candidatus Paceibacterota bacterium]